jgi:hypothetical protein
MLVLLLLTACAHRTPARAETGDTSGTGDTSQDASDTGGPLGAPCGPWAGVARVGTQWTYVPTDAYVAAYEMDGSYTTTVTTIEGALVTLEQEGAYSGASGAFTWARRDTWRCDTDGAWWIRSEAETHATSGDSIMNTTGSRVFEPGWLVRPAVLEAWSDAFTVTQIVNDTAPVVTAAECTTQVSAASPATVEGRAVTTRYVEPTCTGVNGEAQWLGEHVGLVETGRERLLGFLP